MASHSTPGWDAFNAKLAGIPHVPQIMVRANVERSEIIAAAYSSDMPTWQLEELIADLYKDEEGFQ